MGRKTKESYVTAHEQAEERVKFEWVDNHIFLRVGPFEMYLEMREALITLGNVFSLGYMYSEERGIAWLHRHNLDVELLGWQVGFGVFDVDFFHGRKLRYSWGLFLFGHDVVLFDNTKGGCACLSR